MVHTWLWVLLLLSSLILRGHNQERPVAVLTLQPNWTHIFSGESVTFRCDIQGGGDIDWDYSWNINHNKSEYRINPASLSHTGSYTCEGIKRNRSSIISDAVKLNVSNQPKAVLSISPQWLNPGDSVTLICEVNEPSTGWRFSWYKTVPYRTGLPSLLDKSYSVEPLSGYETTEESYTLSPAGPTDTGGYVCRAGRGDPVYYTDYSEPQYLWSGGDSGVYWCESGSGQSSNAVNITVSGGDVILESPAHPVIEGNSVRLRCTYRNLSHTNPKADFYKNGVPTMNQTTTGMTIPTVLKSDEGFYKCQSDEGESPGSWMTVRVPNPGSSTSVLVGLVLVPAGGLLTILLVLLSLYKHIKGSGFNRIFRPIHHQSTNQDPQQDQGPTQVQSPDAGFKGDVTYAKIQPKKLDKTKTEQPDQKENSVYSVVKRDQVTAVSGPNDVTYAETHFKKVKYNKEPNHPPESESVYSSVKLSPSPQLD
ncbi:hypothetical protein DPEC_G00099140 [Dallia pectoralis]|uniref:Uncharacterized protein n=1 Tax=Dallia pectoralis TaxID=75939 RepID=A0ACC2GWY0_DALPE|nr:hypothetical protein DPEC_G00099140 [Dallia pectoralis]